MELAWEGVNYPVPDAEPAQDRDPNRLHPAFFKALQSYISYANNVQPQMLRMGECYRSEARQIWLLAQGRVNSQRVRSWTLNSRHCKGLACDLYMLDAEGKAVWDTAVWQELHILAPPRWFGLTPISQEYVHLESLYADEMTL